MNDSPIQSILIVGGGTAGWLTAAILAKEHCSHSNNGINITLIESSDIETVGVGEGTWPSMRETLSNIGVSETEFIRYCNVTFKQGSKFVDWFETGHCYYHPFSLPQGYLNQDLVPYWQAQNNEAFADLFSTQPQLCESNLAPKQIATPEYAGVSNYGYHLDAGKFATFLKQHCKNNLGVTHIVDNVVAVNNDSEGYVRSVNTSKHGELLADMFIDCSGLQSLLIDKHYKVPFVKQDHILFNDSALAVRVPYENNHSPIASATLSTAQNCGWVWDIGVSDRRGTGYSYASKYQSDNEAEKVLIKYHKVNSPYLDANKLELKKISYTPGYRESFWIKNCVAIGMSSGFLEPLEATAIAMIEKAAMTIRDEMPANRSIMSIIAKRYNENMTYRWQKIIEFLKLHYVLSKRTDSPYWLDNKSEQSIPENLKELMMLWKYHPPSRYDVQRSEEVFPSASYQYVLYGMHFETNTSHLTRMRTDFKKVQQYVTQKDALLVKQLNGLPSHRDFINRINN